MMTPREHHPAPADGRMTRAMRAVRPAPSTSANFPALRIALIRDGVISFEQMFEGGTIEIGTIHQCTIVVDEGPDRHRLVTFRNGRIELHAPVSTGAVLTSDHQSRADAAIMRVAPGTTRAMPMHSRGKLTIGRTRILLHVVAAPPARPRAALPVGVERGVWGSIDWFTTVIAAFSFLLHFFAVALVYSDWMDPVIDDEAVIVRLSEQSKRLPPPPLQTATAEAAATSAPTAAASAAPTSEARSRVSQSPRPGPAGQRRAAGHSPSTSQEAHDDARVAELSEALDALGFETVASLNEGATATRNVLEDGDTPVDEIDAAARSHFGATEDSDLKFSGDQTRHAPKNRKRRRAPTREDSRDDATEEGKQRTVTGPKQKFRSSSGGGDTSKGGKNIPGASGVIARMRAPFRGCYRAGLSANPTLQGSTTLVARVGANGAVTSVGGGGGALAPIAGCLKAVVRGAQFSPPRDGGGVVSITVNFLLTQ